MIAWFLLACSPTPPTCKASGTALHTSWQVRWTGDCEAVQSAVRRTFRELDARLSVWNPESEVNALRRGPQTVDPDTFDAIEAALALAEATEGAFDPTLEPLMVAWGFHGDGEPARPDDARLTEARARVGYAEVTLDRTTFEIAPNGRELDLSAVLEGHAADRIAGVLAVHGRPSALIQVGDEVRVMGEGPDGIWTLGVPETELVLAVTNRGVGFAGSPGNGKRTTLDPRTGERADSDARLVAVVAPTAREADGWATAVSVLGVERGMALLERRPELEGLVLPAGGGLPHTTSGMGAYLR